MSLSSKKLYSLLEQVRLSIYHTGVEGSQFRPLTIHEEGQRPRKVAQQLVSWLDHLEKIPYLDVWTTVGP